MREGRLEEKGELERSGAAGAQLARVAHRVDLEPLVHAEGAVDLDLNGALIDIGAVDGAVGRNADLVGVVEQR